MKGKKRRNCSWIPFLIGGHFVEDLATDLLDSYYNVCAEEKAATRSLTCTTSGVIRKAC